MENKDNKKVKVQVKGLVKSFGELEVLKGMDSGSRRRRGRMSDRTFRFRKEYIFKVS